jgi:endogenous inhibitor of DNA gyrase (YacG/DUF329 family)
VGNHEPKTLADERAVKSNRPMPPKKKSAKILHCPTCGMLVRFDDEDFPFCSDRCRKIDLGKWASGVYKISSPILDPEVLENLGELSGGNSNSKRDVDEDY